MSNIVDISEISVIMKGIYAGTSTTSQLFLLLYYFLELPILFKFIISLN